jgi:hypothetical protein
MTARSQERIHETFEQYFPNSSEKALCSFYDFRHQRGPFHTRNKAWKMKESSLFWAYMRAYCPELASFAERLIRICANSVTSERAWSAMNYIHSKSRNSLSINTVDKLTFIYMNVRTLQRLNEHEMSDDELLAIEDRLIGWG